jgi:hypothetical protein
MELVLTRQMAIEDATIGVLTVDGSFQCFTLEDLTRDKKIAHETAIPPGTYPVSLCESPRFSDKYEEKGLGRIVPLLLHVKNYEGVRIHIGNTAKHTEGCILVGHWKPGLGPRIEHSTRAYKALLARLLGSRTKVRITVINAIEPADKQMIHPKRSLFEGLYAAPHGVAAIPA